MLLEEITLKELDRSKFLFEAIESIDGEVGKGLAVNTLSGGVDSSVVTMLGHLALSEGARIRTFFINNGLMRENEPEKVSAVFKERGIEVEIVDAQREFFQALKGLTDPEEKREAVTQTFYGDVFARLVREAGATHILQGTILTDIEETVAGIKRQHNVLSQLGIDPEKEFGYGVIEPLLRLRKPAVREIAKTLGLPKEVYSRMPFPGPALAARVIGEATPEKVSAVRKATRIVEEELKGCGAFQYMAILHDTGFTGIRGGLPLKRAYGQQIEVRCWDSEDAVTARPTRLPYSVLLNLSKRITAEMPEVISVTYNITEKPPSTMEAV